MKSRLALNYLLKKLPIAMLFIPIDVLIRSFSLLKHLALIMLHDYLHCLVFKEQSCLALLAKCPVASSDSFILSHLFQTVKNFFNFSFLSKFESNLLQSLASQGLLNCFSVLSLSDLYYITRVECICQHLK